MFKLVLEKAEDQIANLRWIMEKAREFQKSIYFCFLDYAKAFDGVDHLSSPVPGAVLAGDFLPIVAVCSCLYPVHAEGGASSFTW